VRAKLSAVVVSYNRASLIGTCLRALGFADEVILVDKSSTDDTLAIATRHADRVITVP
jgi:glycosyltransferase involved in cell wall biosynthesis